MKLAEALVLRADIQRRIEQLRERLKYSVLVQEGDSPPEDPELLMNELDRLLLQLVELISQINRTNTHASLRNGVSLSQLLILLRAESNIIAALKSAMLRQLMLVHCVSKPISLRSNTENWTLRSKRSIG